MTDTGNDTPVRDVGAWLAEASRDFHARIEVAISSSRASAGHLTTERLGWSSWLFTRIVAIAVNITKLLDKSDYDSESVNSLDYGCIGSLGRDLLEAVLTFLYVSEEVSSETWKLRKRVFDLHDRASREQLFRSLGSIEEADKAAKFLPDLKSRLSSEPAFQALSSGYRNKLIKGEMARVVRSEELVKAVGADVDHYRGMVKLMSANIHSTPLAWYRMGDGGRGSGKGSEADQGYTALILEYLNGFIDAANARMRLVLDELNRAAE